LVIGVPLHLEGVALGVDAPQVEWLPVGHELPHDRSSRDEDGLHARRVLRAVREYVAYYNGDRPHLSLGGE
jgi:hypothetical protein